MLSRSAAQFWSSHCHDPAQMRLPYQQIRASITWCWTTSDAARCIRRKRHVICCATAIFTADGIASNTPTGKVLEFCSLVGSSAVSHLIRVDWQLPGWPVRQLLGSTRVQSGKKFLHATFIGMSSDEIWKMAPLATKKLVRLSPSNTFE